MPIHGRPHGCRLPLNPPLRSSLNIEVPTDLPGLFLWISCFIVPARLHVVSSVLFVYHCSYVCLIISHGISLVCIVCPAFCFCQSVSLYDRTYILSVYFIFILFHVISPHCVFFHSISFIMARRKRGLAVLRRAPGRQQPRRDAGPGLYKRQGSPRSFPPHRAHCVTTTTPIFSFLLDHELFSATNLSLPSLSLLILATRPQPSSPLSFRPQASGSKPPPVLRCSSTPHI